jgi:rRNA maturation protein Rpf1
MGVYITTSKNPSKKTKALCKALSLVLPGSVHEQRGGKSIEQVFRRAKLLGKRRVMLVYEKDGVPSRMCFIAVKAHSWDWMGEEFVVSSFRIHKLPKELPDGFVVTGERKEEFERLFDFEKPEGDRTIEFNCGGKKLSFRSAGKPLLEMEMIK